YRAPAVLTVNAGRGSAWTDPLEFTSAGDWFNESDASYDVQTNPVTGLDVDLSGSAATPRRNPMFKIRQWRSVNAPATVGLEAATLAKDAGYHADVKPVTRAYLAQDLLWYSTTESNAAITSPDVGSAGTPSPSGSTPGRLGNAALVNAGDVVSFPVT